MDSKLKNRPFPNTTLLEWYDGAKRPLPWRQTKDPYLVWVSEVILQQTRVDQGMPYYLRFVERFPSLASLAEAKEDEVLKHWEGLGYYSRARNLHFTAQHIHNDLHDKFPDSHEGLLNLKGIGQYTAAAIGSIVFNLPVAAVDGNVYRVLSRFFGLKESIDETATKRKIEQLAQHILSGKFPGDHNQAMMELGATVCVPIQPKCIVCPLQASCTSDLLQLQSLLPIRSKKTKVRERFFYYQIRISGDETLIRRRTAGDIWQGLYEFPYLESEEKLSDSELIKHLVLDNSDVVVSISSEFTHLLSHQRIFAKFVLIKAERISICDLMRVKVSKLSSFAFPKLINRYIGTQGLVIDEEV